MNFTLSSPFHIGSLQLPSRLIQGPLAGTSAAPFRRLFYQFVPPAYAVTEMISAQEVLTKASTQSRYLYRAPEETKLCYQLSGNNVEIMTKAAMQLQGLGADLIDINCGCPKNKIRKKGAGSALMENQEYLCLMVSSIREQLSIPLTVKLRIYGNTKDITLAKALEQAGAEALIIHGRRWQDDYDKPCDFRQIGLIKQQVKIPVIANGDIQDLTSLNKAVMESHADAYMISRAGCGRPWLYQELLHQNVVEPEMNVRIDSFIQHFEHLALLESEHQAMIQSRSFIRYYFPHLRNTEALKTFYSLRNLGEVRQYVNRI